MNKLRTSPTRFTSNITKLPTTFQQTRPISRSAITMQNNAGQGISHAVGDSKVPDAVQKNAPQGVEEALPNSVHDTGSTDTNSSIGKTHAKNDGEDSIVPKGIQKAVPEGLERALPDSIHNTGDSKK